MAHKYTYPVVDRALRNFLMFVLVLIALIALVTTLGASVELIDLPMYYDYGPDENQTLLAFDLSDHQVDQEFTVTD